MSRRDTDARLLELLTARDLGDLSPEEHAELEALLERHPGAGDSLVGELVLAMDGADEPGEGMPAPVRERLATRGRVLVGQAPTGSGPRRVLWPLAAAVLLGGLA
ncbi:MAG: hypothetical protein ACF8Q5_03405, partial [Phycisphaerales bacterium JB040]